MTFQHEHLVRINDPALARHFWLSRRQLWNGLRHTVLVPELIDQSIDASAVRELSTGVFSREIRRGNTVAADEVTMIPEQSLTIRADASGPFRGSSLTIRIEEPAPEMLFVRFVYELVGLEDERTEEEDNARRSAYLASDIERVREARRHAHEAH